MELQIEWSKSLVLKEKTDPDLLYAIDTNKLPKHSGIYVFGRKWGKGFEALYVGKAKNIQSRVNGQFNNLRLMRYIQNAKNGKRIILFGKIKTRRGQQIDKCLTLTERGLIRHFLSEGHDLTNKQGARIRRHEIKSSGKIHKKFVPGLIYLEKARGE